MQKNSVGAFMDNIIQLTVLKISFVLSALQNSPTKELAHISGYKQ